MALLINNKSYSLLDHNDYISKLYRKTEVPQDGKVSYQIFQSLFSIHKDNNKKVNERKRKRESDNIVEEAEFVKQNYLKFIEEIPTSIKEKILQLKTAETSIVRDISKKLFESTVFEHAGLNGGNNLDKALTCVIENETFLVPQSSRFYCGCVTESCKKLNGNKYDLLVADPPWWNKYIRRLKSANDKLSYKMMYNEDIASIPVKELLRSNSLIAVWCTNAPSNIAAVKDLIFPKWGVEYLTTWYWLKVTTDLEPLCEFGAGSKKQPYERIILGKVGNVKPLPENKLIVSVPSALHSHKPPLLELLSPYLHEENPQTLEMFARYLLPHTTSIGYEPLKWQHISLYESVTYFCTFIYYTSNQIKSNQIIYFVM